MVKPMMSGDTPALAARRDAPRTNISAPTTNSTSPMIKKTIVVTSINFFYASTRTIQLRCQQMFECSDKLMLFSRVDDLGEAVVRAHRVVGDPDAGRALGGFGPRGEGFPREAGAGALDLGALREGRAAEEVRAGDGAGHGEERTSVQAGLHLRPAPEAGQTLILRCGNQLIRRHMTVSRYFVKILKHEAAAPRDRPGGRGAAAAVR